MSGQARWGSRRRGGTEMVPVEEQHLQRPEETESSGFSSKGKELFLKQRVHVEERERMSLGPKWASEAS